MFESIQFSFSVGVIEFVLGFIVSRILYKRFSSNWGLNGVIEYSLVMKQISELSSLVKAQSEIVQEIGAVSEELTERLENARDIEE